MQGTNNKILRVLFVAAAVLMMGSCKESGGGSGTDACGNGECKLTASDAAFGDTFGFASAIDGDQLLVGAENHDATGVGSGAVYAYRRVGSDYEEIQKIAPAGLEAGDAFGSAIAIDGDVAVIGARLAKDGNGSAYVFRLVDGQWVEEQELIGIFGELGPVQGQFGGAVAISGDWVAVGAARDNFFDFFPRLKMGSVSMFEYIGTNEEAPWEFDESSGYLTPLGIPEGELFATSVALDGPVLAVGAVGDDDGREDSGAAFVYSLDAVSGTWTLDRKLKAVREPLACELEPPPGPPRPPFCRAGFNDLPDPFCNDNYVGDNFGVSVAVLGDRVVVGADARDRQQKGGSCIFLTTSNENANGGAYVYKETSVGSGDWTLEVRLEPADANNKKAFGRSLAIDTDVIAVGAFGDDDSGLFSGAAYVYRLSLGSVWALDTKLRASDTQANDNFGVSIGIDREPDRAVIGAWRVGDSGPESGAAYVFDL